MAQNFSHILIRWYDQHKRTLPWRDVGDPYLVWLSEIMLQQTQVSQGLPYYEKFVRAFPDVFSLAGADEQEVLKLWQGLGYYSRARNLHHTARVVAHEMNGRFPASYKELIRLKGIGDYTASAIASICFDEAVPTVDGNVYRVLSRVFGIKTPINEHKAKTEFKTLAQSLMSAHSPGTFNQAMMEFGALQCTPKNPDCEGCPMIQMCFAFEHGVIDQLPVKLKKLTVKKRFFDYLIFKLPNHKTLLYKREHKDIWRHLYQFPLIESQTFPDVETIHQKAQAIAQVSQLKLLTPQPVKHKLTHQDISIRFWEVVSDEVIEDSIDWSSVGEYPLPIAIHKFLTTYQY
ncbi:MAG: A/G-specific adenine glycosylase [Flavobacteriia bacterium]|nr:MAG: A/G-specific adenine glycosylase [Flavobacteriia bacterium]